MLLGGLVAKTALQPVTRLTEAAEEVAHRRRLASRLNVRGDDEPARLAASLNTMLADLDTSQRSQRQLVADASHELRTPLSSLRTNLEVLERADELPAAERERLVADVRAEVESLIAAVDDLLDLARDDRTSTELDDVALERLVERSVAWARRRAHNVDFVVRLEPAPSAPTRRRSSGPSGTSGQRRQVEPARRAGRSDPGHRGAGRSGPRPRHRPRLRSSNVVVGRSGLGARAAPSGLLPPLPVHAARARAAASTTPRNCDLLMRLRIMSAFLADAPVTASTG
jgi:hypothetical protein